MEINEANKIIAEYMGYSRDDYLSGWFDGNDKQVKYLDYREHLDDLVSVWEKLGLHNISFQLDQKFCIINDKKVFVSAVSGLKTIQKAACIATAKAIQNLDTPL